MEASALSGENVAQLFMLVGKQVIDSREVLAQKQRDTEAYSAKLTNEAPEGGSSRRCRC